MGWNPVTAKNSREALDAFSVGRFQLVLTNISLDAAMDGIEVARQIKQQEPGMRVVMISSGPGDGEKAKAAGLPLLNKELDFPRIVSLFRHGMQNGRPPLR